MNSTGSDVPHAGKKSRFQTGMLSTAFLSVLLLLNPEVSQAVRPELQITGVDKEFNDRWFDDSAALSREFIQSGRLFSADIVQHLYEENSYRPLWSEKFNDQTWMEDTRTSLEMLKYDALPMWRYHREQFDLLKNLSDKSWLLDIYLTDALVTAINDLSGQLLTGIEKPEQWKIDREPVNASKVVSTLRYGGRVSSAFEQLRPDHPQYRLLQQAYRKMLGRQQKFILSEGKKLELGARGKRVWQLARMLEAEGLFTPYDLDRNRPVFNAEMERSVKKFQKLRGLTSDGVVGRKTRAALNSGPEDIARRIALNLQRWRTIASQFPSSHILVNTAAFNMQVIDEGEKAMEMNVVVGKKTRQTPSFTDTMTEVVLNPNWNIPPRIAREEILPKIREDLSFATRLGIRALEGNKPLNWSEISEEQLQANNFPYRLQQTAGNKNSLGRYKFMFPNPYMVYLHDTPNKSLFSEEKRAYSHGCVRLEEPDKLANYLLAKNGWDADQVDDAISSGDRQGIELENPWPVYLLYLTTWINDEGELQVFPDVYHQDASLEAQLLAVNAARPEYKTPIKMARGKTVKFGPLHISDIPQNRPSPPSI